MGNAIGSPVILPNGKQAPLSAAYRSGNLLFISGQLPFDESGNFIAGDIKEQTKLCLEGVGRILKSEGLGIGSVVKTGNWLVNTEDFADFNEIYSGFFGAHRPARFTVQSGLMIPSALVEIEAIAEYT